ncbi:hypothetical protein, partial [Klebsiella pneumoniae]|uniref:hypothetical protein n=1 Tax=Klebsiella pneumoniae TaxID=573 RepID=UPI001D0F480A
YGPQNDVTLKMPAFEWVHVQLHQQKGMISLSPPTICNSAICAAYTTIFECSGGNVGDPRLPKRSSTSADLSLPGITLTFVF